MSVASVTTAFNAAGVLPRQIEALLHQTRAVQEIIVVDNASRDGTAEMLARAYPKVTVLRMPENVGAAGAWAAGLEYAALTQRYDWVWSFDDDSVPEAGALELMLAAAGQWLEDRQVGMVAGMPVHRAAGCTYTPLLWKNGWRRPTRELADKGAWFADLVIASGALVSRQLVEAIGLPRADFFMDFFDFEYCLRARAHGFSIAVVPDVRIEHEIGHTHTLRLPGYARTFAEHAPWREYYMARNVAYAGWWLYPGLRTRLWVLRQLARHVAGVLLLSPQKLACVVRMAQGFADGVRARLGIRFRPT